MSLIERFWSHVETSAPDACWPWLGKRVGGYGYVRDGARLRIASRVAYELAHGAIPAGLEVCHACDNPACVNPAHLFTATHAQNMADRQRKGRQARGERNGRAKLTAAQVAEIRARGGSQRALARAYGVERTTIRGILRGEIWRNV